MRLTSKILKYFSAGPSEEIVFTGIQPTGNLHIGNYLGSIRSIVDLQKHHNNLLLCIVDYHALTTRF
jgi:tryptophanyl-tRNA synthetase